MTELSGERRAATASYIAEMLVQLRQMGEEIDIQLGTSKNWPFWFDRADVDRQVLMPVLMGSDLGILRPIGLLFQPITLNRAQLGF